MPASILTEPDPAYLQIDGIPFHPTDRCASRVVGDDRVPAGDGDRRIGDRDPELVTDDDAALAFGRSWTKGDEREDQSRREVASPNHVARFNHAITLGGVPSHLPTGTFPV